MPGDAIPTFRPLPAIRADGRTGVMVCGHGSRDADAVAELAALARTLAGRLEGIPLEYGYLEFARPVIADGLDRLGRAGVSNVLALPAMLFAAGHTKNDIPSVLNGYAARHGAMRIRCGRDLGIDARMLRAAAERIGEALDGRAPVARHDTLLMVVGRGASDPDANSNVAKVMRLLWEGLGFGWGETAYSGVTFPLVAPALERAARLGFARIVVFPYFLFTGILVRRIHAAVDRAAAAFPGIEFVKAPYLGQHRLVVDTMIERIGEIDAGTATMNCQMCKYRERLIGFEDEVGLPQASHHHHVEGIGTGERGHEHHHAHGDGHGHGHEGGHHPYPHADHPLGPLTLKGGRGAG
jgi:sirohydrochlorin cobaltochelatase